MQISAVTEEEALSWARSLRGENKRGWTRGVYRYRVYKTNHITYVTVIDQSRELLPCFRILLICLHQKFIVDLKKESGRRYFFL